MLPSGPWNGLTGFGMLNFTVRRPLRDVQALTRLKGSGAIPVRFHTPDGREIELNRARR
jgi:hypothetical protein